MDEMHMVRPFDYQQVTTPSTFFPYFGLIAKFQIQMWSSDKTLQIGKHDGPIAFQSDTSMVLSYKWWSLVVFIDFTATLSNFGLIISTLFWAQTNFQYTL